MNDSRWSFDAIGTGWNIDTSADEEVRTEVLKRISAFDANYSRFRSDSLVRAIAKKAGAYDMPEDFAVLWSVYTDLYTLTHGAFTPLVGTVLEDLGYDEAYSLQKKDSMRPILRLPEVLTYTHPQLVASQPALLDIGAGGKGYLIDIVGDILKTRTSEGFTINAGGDILHRGEDPLRVGLEDPSDVTQVLGIIEIKNESICGSAGNRRRLGAMHHIIDPETKESPKGTEAVWVIAQTALVADALATALYFTEPEELLEHYAFDWAILSSDRSVRFSRRFEGAFF